MKSATGFASAVSLILLASCARPPAAKPGTAAPAAVPAAIEGTWREIRNENQPVTGKTWTFAGNRVIQTEELRVEILLMLKIVCKYVILF